MHITYIYISVLILIFIGVIYYISFTTPSYEISSKEARQNFKMGKYDYIIDVRTREEWNEGHLPNVINIPIGELVSELPKKIPDKNARILFVCKKGIRASGVVVIAHKLDYNNVQAMIGNYRELSG
jgi:rhodanese-related sulfurtransferase